MFRKIFNSIYFFFFNLLFIDFYREIKKFVSEKEKVLYKHNLFNIDKGKLVIFLNDKELGEKLYHVIKPLCKKRQRFNTGSFSFKIDKCLCEKNIVKCYRINFSNTKKTCVWISKEIMLYEKLNLIKEMFKKGFILDESRFNDISCESYSEFFSYFVPSPQDTLSKELEIVPGIMEYVHYICSSGGNLQEFYKEHTGKGKLYPNSDIPYSFKIAKECYNYFIGGRVSKDIGKIILEEGLFRSLRNQTFKYLVAIDESFKDVLAKTEETEEYSVYDKKVKIYKNMSTDFQNILKNEDNNQYLIEKIDKVIINLDREPLGYTLKKHDNSGLYSVLDYSFSSQYEIFEFLKKLIKLIKKFRDSHSLQYSFQYYDTNFDFEKDFFLKSEKEFFFGTIKDLYNFMCIKESILKKNVTECFFKIFLEFINQKYGKLSSKKRFLELKEVRIISPAIAKEFINFALDMDVNYELASNDLWSFVLQCSKVDFTKSFYYDIRFDYNPIDKPFLFDFEAEKKFSLKLKKGTTSILQDGRKIVIFKRSKDTLISSKEKNILEEIKSKMNLEERYGLKFIGISEVIYSKETNKSDTYNVIGYVTEEINGKCLKDVLLTLNNKELCDVIGKVFWYFKDYSIPLECIWLDKKLVYINIWDENFRIQKNNHFLGDLFQNMLKQGYNPNAIAFLSEKSSEFSKFQDGMCLWQGLESSLNLYCNEHKIYYGDDRPDWEKIDSGFGIECPICSKTKVKICNGYERIYKKVFEDEYGIHYANTLSEKCYNLKIYKNSCANLAEIEKNIDEIIDISEPSKLDFKQDCFLPIKKAVDSQNRFIGYTYIPVQFQDGEESKDVCIDIEDISSIKNLPRIKCLIRLILQVTELTSQNLGFMENPFSHVFLNADHKRQVQILNIDLLHQGNVENTLKWTYEYICHVLENDSSIEADIPKFEGSLNSILYVLQDLESDLKKYCMVHRMYYSEEHIFCPKCINIEKQGLLEFERKEKEWFEGKNCDMEGGESFIYHYGENQVAKVFKKEEINFDLKIQIMLQILKKSEVLEKCNKENHKFKFIYTKKFLLDPVTNEVFGCIMDEVKNAHSISYLRDKENVKKMGFTLKDVLEILIIAAEGIQTLHEKTSIFIGDLNGGNILFDSDKNVYFVDFDGMGIGELSPEFCTDGYIDPVSKKNNSITMKDDWYSFAVQAFYYLTYTHPFNGIYSVFEDGKEVMLDITEKMEKRISLLGPHGMKPPAIAESWDWMEKGLKEAFFNIFENDARESIESQLKKQYELLFSCNEDCQKIKKIVRINDNFIAKKLERFEQEVLHVYNENVAIIRKEDDKYYFNIVFEDEKCFQLKDFLRGYDGDIVDFNDVITQNSKQFAYFVMNTNRVIAVNLNDTSEIFKGNIQNANNIVSENNCLYYIWYMQNEAILECLQFVPGSGISKKDPINLGKKRIKYFNVKHGNKFVLVAQSSDDNVDYIYCNDEKLCSIKCTSPEAKYGIYYDSVSKLWLVVNGDGKGIFIEPEGTYKNVDFSEYINNINVSNIYFEKGYIYIPSDDCLYIIIKANDNSNVKKLECPKIMTYASRLFDINTKGFSVITGDTIYEVRRG